MTRDTAPSSSTLRSLARLLPFARPVAGRLILGAVSALIASLLALGIPLILEVIVGENGPITSGATGLVAVGAGAILLLRLLAAPLVRARPRFILAPSPSVDYPLAPHLFSH